MAPRRGNFFDRSNLHGILYPQTVLLKIDGHGDPQNCPFHPPVSGVYFGAQRVAMKQGSTLTFLHGDHLGSTSVASNTSGAFHPRQTYYAFGAVRTSKGTLPTDYTFTGQKRDNEANLIFYNARYYVGITNNLARRMAEHTSARVWELTPIRGLDKLSRFDARAVEQVLIEAFKLENLQNRINSIARTNPVYEEAIRRRQELLANIHWHW